jgi:hypothetical protein
MNITIFVILMALSVVVVLMGYFTGDEPYLPVGLFFLFLLGLATLTAQVEYESGTAVTTNYTYSGSTVTQTDSDITYTYTAWNDTASHWVGWSLCVLSFAGIGLSLFHLKNRRAEEDA